MTKEFATCCNKAKENLQWFEPDSWNGPDFSGWCVNTNNGGYPDPAFEVVYFCPWCGRKLPQKV